MHLTEEGEELRGLRQPVPRHHSFLFHEKSRDSIDRGSDSNIQISATISSSRSSNSSSSSGGGSSSSSSLRVNQPSLIRVDVENGNPSTLKRVGRKGQKKESSTSSSDEVLCDFPTLTEDIGRRTSHSKPKKEPSELKEEATKKRPLLSVPYADTVPSVARKVRNTEKQPVRSESKKRPLREESISLSPKAVKRIRSAPVRLSD